MTFDFEVVAEVHVESEAEVASALRSISGPVRVVGAGSAQDRIPAPTTPVTLLHLKRLDRILRLEPGDMTCSLEPGVSLASLDAALAEHRLCLPIDREFGTTIGGAFARGERMQTAPAQQSTRSLILGMRAVLAEGLEFKAGAQVVKSVAGFDVHRAFVGSRGRLCVAKALHVKVRPLPEATISFREAELERTESIERFRMLRRLACPPSRLSLVRSANDGSFAVAGAFAGRTRVVESQLQALALEPTSTAETRAPSDGEWITGLCTMAELPQVFDSFSGGTWLRVSGGSQFDAVLSTGEADATMHRLSSHGLRAELIGGPPNRRGRTTSPAGLRATRLEGDLRRALDPMERLR